METAASFEKPGKFFKRRLEKPAGFPTVPTGPAAVNQQNRTDHLLQKPDTFICYRQFSTPRCRHPGSEKEFGRGEGRNHKKHIGHKD